MIELLNLNPASLIAALMVASTPIILAALGELVVEKAGVLNLGVEGMMITGAICGFIISVETGSPVFGFVAAAIGAMLLSLVFAFLTQVLMSNQVPTGLALTLFGIGFSALIGQGYNGIKPPATARMDVFGLADTPGIGKIFFNHDWMVYFALFMVFAVWFVLKHTRIGLILRAVGENHDAAHALGYKVVWVRVCAIAFGGALAGLGGAYISLVRVPQWTEGMTAGAGWIALAIVVFSSWRPGMVLLGAYLFGGITVLQLNMQAANAPIPVQYLSMSPFVITILVLVFMSVRAKAGLNAPAALGRSFHASQ